MSSPQNESAASSSSEEEYDFDKRKPSPVRPASPWSPSVSDESPIIPKIPSRPPPSPSSRSVKAAVVESDESSLEESEEELTEKDEPVDKHALVPQIAGIHTEGDILPALINPNDGNQCQDCGKKFPSLQEASFHECESRKVASSEIDPVNQLLMEVTSNAELLYRKLNESKSKVKVMPKTVTVLAPGEKPCKRTKCGRKRYKRCMCKYHYYKWYYARPGAIKPRQRSRAKKM